MLHPAIRRPRSAFAVALATGLAAFSASGATFQVTQIGDSGGGSLRQAILDANASPGADTIQFNLGVILTPPVFVIEMTALPAITGDLTITGPGASQVIVQPDPVLISPAFSLFTITGTPTVEIRGLSITNGGGTEGAAIRASGGTLTVRECSLYQNNAGTNGGAIAMSGAGSCTLNVIDSVIFANNAIGVGGGIAVIRTSGAATVNITGSTLGRNTTTGAGAGHLGGGLYVAGGAGPHTVNITGSTISDNAISSGGSGGGLYMDGVAGASVLNLLNATVSGNTAGSGSAIHYAHAALSLKSCTFTGNNAMDSAAETSILDASNASMIVKNTILSGNIAGGGFRDLAAGQQASGNNNLVGVGGPFSNGVNGNLVGVTNPRLVSINVNGGTNPIIALQPLTFSLQPDSPALDAGSNADVAGISIDQRGQPRIADGDNNGTSLVDIGAFETQRYLVTNTQSAGSGSLRQAIVDNNGAGGGFVKFAIAPLGQAKTISPAGALPQITRIAFIDGWSQGGQSYQGPPLVEVEGSAAPDAIGLDIQWSDCIIRGLSINNFSGVNGLGVGVRIDSARGVRNWIYGNYVGVRPDGVTARGNGQIGVWIRPTANSNIIGTNADNLRDDLERNVISGSSHDFLKTGVYIESNSNIVAGNNIGTDVTGTIAIPNFNGVWVRTGSSNQIGSSAFSQNPAAERNVIAGNQNVGIAFTSQGSNNFVSGNYVGVRATGTGALPNMIGVVLDDVNRTLVGGTSAGERNVISGNQQHGLIISGVNAYSNLVQGNYIGTNALAAAAIPNGFGGILLRGGVTFARVGAFGDNNTPEPARRNVISGNNGPGVQIQDVATTDNRVMGNYIGVAANGVSPIGNTAAGVLVLNSPGNLIGSPGSGRNIIGGQTTSSGDGVAISGEESVANKVRNNSIGVAVDGTAVGNAGAGVTITDSASGNLVGGTLAGEGNIISNNGAVGVRVLTDGAQADSILANSIIGNSRLGIDLKDDGVTPNGPAGVIRTGPNALQNYPVLVGALPTGQLTATLAAKPATTYRIEYFSSVAADPSTFGEGRTFLGFRTVQTDAAGNVGPFTFSASLPVGEIAITATATELAASAGLLRGFPTPPGSPLGTSEFSMARLVNTAPTTANQAAGTLEDTDVIITLIANDPDPSPDLSYRISSLPTTGQLLQFGTLAPIVAPGDLAADPQGRVVFRPAPDQFGSPYSTFEFVANDTFVDSNQSTVTVNVAPVADTPSVTDSSTQENVQTTSGLVIARNPVDGAEVTHFKITAITSGTLFQNDGVTPISSGAFITVAQGNAGLKFTPALNFNGTATFNVQASIGPADAGIGGGTVTAHIVVAPIGNQPSVTNATTLEDTQSTSGLVISRNAADGSEITHFKILSITNGTLFQIDGLTPIADGSFITVAQAAAGLKFSPTADFFGPASFQVRSSLSASDAGVGGPAAPALVTVTPVADTPSVTDSSTLEDVQTTSGLIISRNPVDGAEVTHFRITAITNGALFQNDGVTPIVDGQFITFAQGNAGLKFTPAPNFSGNGSFVVHASIGASAAGIGGGPALATIVISPVADLPAVTNATTLEDTQSSSGLIITRNAADSSEITHFRISALSTGQLFQSDGTTPIADGAFISAAQGAAGLRYMPPADFNGPVTFSVQASLSATAAGLGPIAGASITVLPVNDRPTLVATDPPTVLEDSGPAVVSGWVSSFVPGPANESTQQVLGYTLSGISNPSLFAAQPTVDIAGVLRYTPAPDASGTSQITVTVRDDGGTSNGGIDTSTPQTFTITVSPVNDQPSFVAANPPAVLEASSSHTVSGFISSFTAGPVNESGQQISAALVDQVSNPGLFADLPTISNAGVLSYSVASSGFGTSTFRVRVRDNGGTANGGVDTSDPQTFTIIVRPAAVCHDVTLDARTSCITLTVQPGDLNRTPSNPGPGATQAITFSRPLTTDFHIGVTPVTVTATYSDGLVSSCLARVTVLATDCNQNGIPDSCETQLGGLTDCNNDSIPDDCQCLWDDGMVFATDAPQANGQLSHFGSVFTNKVADDFYLPPGRVYRLLEFKGQIVTNTVLHKAQLEFYEDCDGRPALTPFKVYTNSIEEAAVPASPGYVMVTYSFSLCADCLFLDGGKSYWVSLVGITDFTNPNDASYWATTTPVANPSGMMGLPPMKREGVGGPPPYPSNLLPWSSATPCCQGCSNLAWKITGEPCQVAWNNGTIDLNTTGPAPTAGGSPSDYDTSIPYLPRTADNFILRGCEAAQVCYLETFIWTNCNPVRGFAEIYDNDCAVPGLAPILTAQATRADLIPGATLNYNGTTLNAYKLVFCAPPGWTLAGGKNYWISSGSAGGTNVIGRSLFANSAPDCNNPLCTLTHLTPGKFLDHGVVPWVWTDTPRDYAFRIAVRGSLGLIDAQPTVNTPACPTDMNGDGTLNAQDIFDFLSAWFSGCP